MVKDSGLYNVTLTKCDNIITNYTWKYTYYDKKKKKLRGLSSYDLLLLRKKVEDKGLEWVVTDLDKATESYELNRELMSKHEQLKKKTRNKMNTSGVKYVCKNKEKYAKNGYYWRYRDNTSNKTYSRKTLRELKELITSLGYDWIIVNEDVYNQSVQEEKEKGVI